MLVNPLAQAIGLHARLSCSNHRWPNCAGSIREEARYEDVAGEAAIDGTGSHLLLELCMDNNVRAEQYIGQLIGVDHHDKPGGWLVHRDRAERVQECLDYLLRRHHELTAEYPGCTITMEAESHADPGGAFGRSDWWGTVDITITVKCDGIVYFVEICDYKDGRGWVNAKDNTQLLSYGFGKIREYVASGPDLVRPFKPEGVRNGVRLSIVQPKTNPSVRFSDIGTHRLIEEAEVLQDAARKTDDEDAPVVPGKHCQWCKANPKRGGHCDAAAQSSIKKVRTMNLIPTTEGADAFEMVSNFLKDVENLDAETLSKLMEVKDGLLPAFDRVEAEITKRVETGAVVPGYAMRPGRGSKVYSVSEEEVVKKLKARRIKKDQMYPAKLITPAALMSSDLLTKEQKDKLADEIIVTKVGKDKLTRVAVGEEVSVDDMFKDIPQDVAQEATAVVQSEPEPVAEITEPVISFL